jgi:hypothetical protein
MDDQQTEGLTLTWWEATNPEGKVWRFPTEGSSRASWARDFTGHRAVTHTYRVGDLVEVDAFGRWRPGTVVRIGKSRVRAEFVRNAQGETDERAFGALSVRPRS